MIEFDAFLLSQLSLSTVGILLVWFMPSDFEILSVLFGGFILGINLISFLIAEKGKISSKNGEEPSGLITRTQYNYEAPSIHEEGRSETTTQTTTLGNRRLSTGPQITEAIEDSEESRRSSKRYVSSRSSSGTKITEILENGTDSRRSSTHEEADGKLNGILKKSGSGKFNVASSTVVTTSTSETVTNGDSSRKSSVDAERRKPSLVRGDSIKALQHKFQQATVSSSLKQNSGASVRNRSSSNSLDSSTRTTTKTSQPVESSQNETSVKTSSYSVKSKTESTSSGPTSFLDNKSKVTGVQDILERMRNADLASDVTESTEDQEARSLLNKFLGASVILQGMEAGMKSINGRSPQSLTTNSATLVNRVEKQRMASEAKTQNLDELDLETIWDEQHLKNLLEACTDYEGRRKIRARLRTVMAEHKACGDVTALVSNSVGADASMTQGECAFMRSHSRESSTIDDSGTESGEDLRHLSPQLLAEVQGALSRLEGALPGLDPNRRESLVQLVSRLQTCLKIQQPNPAPPHPPPRRFSNKRTSRHSRHTVGVSREELDDARKWLEENYPDLKSKQVTKDDIDVRDRQKSTGSLPFNSEASQSKHYRPVKFNAHHTKKKSDPDILNRSKKKIVKAEFHQPKLHQVSYTDKEAPQSASISFVDDDTKTESTESLLDYDPNLRLFNSSHSKLVNRTLSKPENGSDGDISSAEEDLVKPLNSAQNDFLSSHQKFANFLASENKKQNRFQGRSSKKMKLRRSNTIDIPKPIHYLSSGDDHEAGSADEVSRMRNGARGKSNNTSNRSSIAFEPKTENDRKFLAFLKLADQSEAESKLVVYNSSARGGPHWSSRFSNMKTKFETLERDSKSQSSGTAVPMPNQNKRSVLDKVKQLNAVDSLPVKPIQPTQQISTNQFSHAPRSPFRPICKSPQNPWVKPSASGTVKQMVKEKFCHEATGPPMYLPPPKTTPTHDIVMPQPIRKNIMPTTSNVQKPFSYSSNSVCQQNAFPNYPQGTPMENNFNAATRNQSIQNMYPPDTKFCTNTLFNPSAIPLTPEINPPPPFRNNSNEQFYNSKVLTQYRLPSEANPHLFKTPVQAPYIKPQSPTPFNSHVPQYIPQKDAALNNPSEIPLHPSPYLPPSVNPYPTSISPVNYRPNNTIKHNFPTPDYSPVNYSPFSNSPYNSSSANGSGPLNEKFFPPTDSRSVTLASPYLNQNGQYSVSDPNFHNSQNSSFMMNHSVPFASVNPSPASISGFSTPLNSISNSVTPNFNNTPIENTPLAASNTPNIPFLNNRNSVNIPFTDGLTVSEKAPLNHVSERKNMFTRNFDNFLSDNEEVKAKLSQSSNPHRNSVHNFSNFYEQKPYEPVPIQKTYSLSNIHTKQDLNPSFERNFDPFYSELQPASMSSYPPSSIASNVSSPRFDIIPSSRNYPAETKSYFTPEPLSDNRNSIYASGAHSYSTSNKANGESLPYSSPHLEPTTPIRCLDQPDYESTNTNPKLANISPFQFDDASSSPSSWKEAEPETSPSVMQPQTAVSKVMGKAQCQQAVVVSDRTRHRFDEMAQKLSAELSQKMQSPSDRSKSPSGASVSSGHQSRSSSLHSNFMSPVKSPSSSKSLPYGQNISSSLNRSSSSYSMTSATTSPSSHSSSSPFHSLHQAKSSSNLKSESDSQRPSPPQSPTIIKATPANKPPGPPLSPSFQQIPPISNSPFLAQFGMGAVKSKSQHLLSPASSPFCQSQNFSSTRSSPANPAFTSYSPDLMTPMAKFPSSHFSSPSRSPARSPTSSVLQKSESWHQMVVEQMLSAKQAPPLPKISRAKSSHALAYPKQYEASMSPDAASKKQATVKEYLRKSSKSSSACAVKANFKKATSEKNSSATTLKKEAAVVKLNDDLGNVDEAFESLFQESKKKQSK
ncbi:unnamed protein product [Bemisia tabaci]|uniref:Smoothelin domain-containing protein n=1 Tax=Bemisia tabaci TaxID=7038 RepID=A0A9P0CE04_BEMTA|nr:unnamed protein product [Bemisia tabaci]